MKKLFGLAVSLLAVLAMTGCMGAPGEPDKSPEEMVQESFNSMYEVKSVVYDFTVDGVVVPPEGEGDKITFDMSISGAQDITDPSKPKFSMVMDGEFSLADGDPEMASGELRFNADNIFFRLTGLSDFEGAVPAEMVEPFMNKWYQMEIPAEMMLNYSIAGDEENMTEEQKAMKKLMEDTQFFKDLKYEGTDGGAYHYSGMLDTDAVIGFLKESSEIMGQSVSERDIEEMEEVFEMMEMSADMWIDSSNMYMTKMAFEMSMDIEGGTIDMTMESELTDFDKPVTIEEPADAEIFDPMMLLGPMMMMQPGMEDMEMEVPSDPFAEGTSSDADIDVEGMEEMDLDELNAELDAAMAELDDAMAELEGLEMPE